MDTSSTDDLAEYTGEECDWLDLTCNAKSFGHWLFDALLFIPRKVFQLLTEGLADVINAIPVPDWVGNVSSSFGDIPSGVVYFASIAHLNTGVAIVISASVIRFLIRRIPFIG